MPNESTKPEFLRELLRRKDNLILKARLLNAVRAFFCLHGFLEVETPLLINAPAPEAFIDAPAAGNKFLRPSPELEMKQMLCAGYEKIFQIGSCFRAGEHGCKHREEFSMLEFYEVGVTYREQLEFTQRMLRFISLEISGSPIVKFQGSEIDLSAEPQLISVDEAFGQFTDTTAQRSLDDDSFDQLMVEKIEPNLGLEGSCFLIDYPPGRAAFSRLGANERAERWELYLGGLEIANAYGELTDPLEQRRRFKAERSAREENQLKPYPEIVEFLQAIDSGMPEAAGCALGIDRLAMIFADTMEISDIKAF